MATTNISSKSKTILVKRVEGSATMNQWRELATPSLVGALEKRSGIKVKGGSPPNVCTSSTSTAQFSRANIPLRANTVDSDSGVNSDADGSTTLVEKNNFPDLSWISFSRKTILTPGTYSFVSSRVMQPAEKSFYSPIASASIISDNSILTHFIACSNNEGKDSSIGATSLTQTAERVQEHSLDVLLSPFRKLTGETSKSTITTITNSSSPSLFSSTILCESKVVGGLCDLALSDHDVSNLNYVVSQCPPGIFTRSTMRQWSSKDTEPVD